MLSEAELQRKKNELVEHIGVHIEKIEKFPPVASRMYAAIMLSCKEGITFDGLIEELSASKSTVSTHLNMLETQGRIEYFTKSGDRKRYYIPASNQLIRFIDEKIESNKKQHEIQKQIIRYKQEINTARESSPERQCNLQFNENFLVFLEESIASFKKLKIRLTEQ